MMRFELIDMSLIDWGKTLDAFPDKTVFQTPAWLSFIAETQKAQPILAALKECNDTLGYFTALTVKKFVVTDIKKFFDVIQTVQIKMIKRQSSRIRIHQHERGTVDLHRRNP